jgi:hypothetical protein
MHPDEAHVLGMTFGEAQVVRLETPIELLRELDRVFAAKEPVDVGLLAAIRELLREAEGELAK